MNPAKIESDAVQILTTFIYQYDYLKPEISKGDKASIIDGNIFFYNDTANLDYDYKKEDLKYKVPIQVKGKEDKKGIIVDGKRSFSLSELKSYRSYGGIIFFFVYVISRKIFYINFNLSDLNSFINKMESDDKKYSTLSMIEIDKSTNLYNILEKFNINKQYQAYSNGNPLKINKNIYKRMKSGKYRLRVVFDELVNYKEMNFLGKSAKMYLTDKDNLVCRFIGDGSFVKKTYKNELNNYIKIYGIYPRLEYVEYINGNYLLINNFIKLYEDSRIDIEEKDFTLNSYIEDIYLVKSYMNDKNVIGEKKDIINNANEILREMNRLNYINNKFNLNYLNKNSEYKYSDNIDIIVENINLNKKKSIDDRYYNSILKSLENNQLLCTFIKIEENKNYIIYVYKDENSIRIADFLKSDNIELVKESDGKKIVMPKIYNIQYNILKDAVNICYRYLNYELLNIDDEVLKDDSTTNFLLNLIKLFDFNKIKNADAIFIAYRLVNNILDKKYSVYNHINKLQIEKRILKRKFDDDKAYNLLNKLNKKQREPMVLLSLYVILEMKNKAQKEFNKLNNKDKKIFKEYPIYNLYEKLIKN